MIDQLLEGGLVIDGSGAPGVRADVGITDGVITHVGEIDEPAAATIDASDLVVAPGFVDPHTHYDAQLFWDPLANPSNLHGVTSIFNGNCGFSLAPLRPDDAECVVELKAYHPLAIEVVDRSGRGLEGVHVQLLWGTFDPLDHGYAWVTDEDGRVRIPKLEHQLWPAGYRGPAVAPSPPREVIVDKDELLFRVARAIFEDPGLAEHAWDTVSVVFSAGDGSCSWYCYSYRGTAPTSVDLEADELFELLLDFQAATANPDGTTSRT